MRRISCPGQTRLFCRSCWRRQGCRDNHISEQVRSELTQRLEELKNDAVFRDQEKQAFAKAALDNKNLTSTAPYEDAWEGNEKTSDTVLRMLTDKYKRPRIKGLSARPQPSSRTGVSAPTSLKPRKENKAARIAMAKEQSLDYTLSKKAEKDESQEHWRPTPKSLEALQSLADAKIDEAISRGQFRNLPGRGRPMEREYLKGGNGGVDRTEYILNGLIQRQGALPAWIDAQNQVLKAMAQFRQGIRNEWQSFVVKMIAARGDPLPRQVELAQGYALAEEEQSSHRFRDPQWEGKERPYIDLVVKDINSQIRGYNAIAPYTVRMGYLQLDEELEQCFADVAPSIANALVERANAPAPGSIFDAGSRERGVFGDLFGDGVQVHEKRGGEYGLKEFFMSIFGRRSHA